MAIPSSRVDSGNVTPTNGQHKPGDKNVWFYEKDLDVVPEKARHLLETYSKIPAEKVREHVYDIPGPEAREKRNIPADNNIDQRERAWQVHPYPCIGGWRFLILNIDTIPEYSQIQARLQDPSNNDKLLDLGCCFGQELRQLVADGAPANRLVGFDLYPDYFPLGDELFNDTLVFNGGGAQMIAGDGFNPPAELKALEGKFGIVYAGAFFHLFDRPEQLAMAKLVGRMLKDTPGGICVGRQVGDSVPGVYADMPPDNGKAFRHDENSWTELWCEAGLEMGIEWDVQAELVDRHTPGGMTLQELRFCVTRM